MTFIHGGQLEKIKQQFPHTKQAWIDLSTGVSPFSYPMDPQSNLDSQNLPQYHAALNNAAAAYYGSNELLLTPGSMWSIQNLPLIRRLLHGDDNRPVLIPKQGFNEHKKAWQAWGFDIELYNHEPSVEQLMSAQACVIINPNNPTGKLFKHDQLANIHKILSAHNAYLIVDEAFLDLSPESSMASYAHKHNLIILKSFGKFFGLPGLRVGALIAQQDILHEARKLLNEWSISSVAQTTAIHAFLDIQWCAQQTTNIKTASKRLSELLKSVGFDTQGTELFQTHYSDYAKSLYEYLLSHAIYVRLLDDESGVRFGLPKYESEWGRFENALLEFKQSTANKVLTLKTTNYKKAEPA